MQTSQFKPRKAGPARAGFHALHLTFIVLGLLLGTGRAQAYPWMIKHGYANCATCHSDPSGGELLTSYGRVLSEEFLSTQWKKSEVASTAQIKRWALTRAAHSKNAAHVKSSPNKQAAPDSSAASADAPADSDADADAPADSDANADAATAETDSDAPAADAKAAPSPPHAAEGHEFFQPFFGIVALPDTLLLGGSIRMATLYIKGAPVHEFPMQLDLYGDYKLFDRLHIGGSIGAARLKYGDVETRRAQITTNQGDGYNLISRTHYLRFDFGDGAYSVSAGRLNLPFGIRMSEHTMWVRAQTLTDRESSQEHGVSLNMNFDNWRFEVMGILGNYQVNPDAFRKRGYSGYAEWNAWDGGAFGVSSLITHSKLNPLNPTPGLADTRQAHGAFLRTSLGHDLVMLAEGDLLLHTQMEPGYVGFTQLDYEIVRGVHALGTGEVLNTDYPKDHSFARLKGKGDPAFGGWLGAQWFFISHFDLRVDAIFRQASPFTFLGQLHVYL
jgi:hypothetical protein